MHRIKVITLAHATPYSLVFREEAVLPLEIQLPSLRAPIDEEIKNEGKSTYVLQTWKPSTRKSSRHNKTWSYIDNECPKTFSRHVRVQSFQNYNLLLAIRSLKIIDREKEKLEPNQGHPFIVEKVYSNRTYPLMTIDGDRIIAPHKCLFLKKVLSNIYPRMVLPHRLGQQKIISRSKRDTMLKIYHQSRSTWKKKLKYYSKS